MMDTNEYFLELKKDIDKHWEEIFLLAVDVCKSCVLKYARQHKLSFKDDYVYDISVEAASKVMKRIKDGKDVQYFITYCWLPVWDLLAGKKQQRIDNEQSWDLLNENDLEIEDKEGNDISMIINNLTICTLQRSNDCNNILVRAVKPHATTFKEVMVFLDILYTIYGIDYVSIYLENPIWNKILGKFYLLKSDEKQYYGRISENLPVVRKYSRGE